MKYLQINFGDVCTLINVLNIVVDAFKDETAEHIVLSYMDKSTWLVFKDILEYTTTAGYGIKEVLKLLCKKCRYQHKMMSNTCICQVDASKTILLQSTATHATVLHYFYMFDSNYNKV